MPLQLASQQSGVAFSDAHVHLNDPVAWLRTMDALGIARSVVLAGRSADNAALLDAGRRWPGRVLPFVSVSPEHREFRAAWAADAEHLGMIVDSLLARGGFYGVGEISVSHFPTAGFPEADFDPNGRAMRAILRAARRHDVPVLVHCEVTRLREFELLLRAHSDVTVIWAHGGYTPLFLARRLLKNHPNLIYELSARTWAKHPRSPDYTIFQNENSVWPEWLALIEELPSRFLVGTDASGRLAASDAANALRVQLLLSQLSGATRSLVGIENLERLLKLPDEPADAQTGTGHAAPPIGTDIEGNMAHTHEYDCIVCGAHFDSQNELVSHNELHMQSASGMERPRKGSSSNDALQRDRDRENLGRS